MNVVYQGEFEQRDSSGGRGKIGAGDVQWMTAGKGIVHEEFQSQDFTRKDGTLQMVQLWVNLRAKVKSAKPDYQTLRKAQIRRIALPQGMSSADSHVPSSNETLTPVPADRRRNRRQSLAGSRDNGI